jgi:DNA helicase IV
MRPAVDDLLLEELERARDARMRDIVATIQGDQYRLIAREPEPPLVVRGGPGTGKPAVGLHGASFVLYKHWEALRRVLVVGPNPTFMDYAAMRFAGSKKSCGACELGTSD